MKCQNFISIISTFLLLFTSVLAAWPGVFEAARPGALIARQDSDSQTQSASASQTEEASASASASATQTSDDNYEENTKSASASESASASASGSGSASGTRTASSSITGGASNKNSTKTAIDPRLPPGGVSMISPAATDGMTFVKVGNQVTFKWNYTSLSVTPNYIDVVATNTINHQTYTIAANQSTEQTQEVVWDTNEFTKTTDLPFVVATYTLMIYDAASEPTDVAKAGYLGAFSNLQFGVYTPQAYVPLNEFRCSTCSSAMSLHEKQALTVLLGTCTITILSFTWFASGVFHLF
ncbi:hypothetical protein LTR70_003015 [Exophiala xenobiotica]|uniref:DUF7137 domain-containing protein n=1 Tax=Lithohypha guttulata TaxID=1690604 RepID=A0ABR0K8J1_9EURO|nr:hypothetical protein LTR24_005695 [Lithohypha guttulata]KAK5324385.1 hypothetical protein LTR70_003015 [Exophiala xenobiotica]